MAVKFVSNEGNATVVKVIQSASADQQPGSNPEIRKRSYAETAQFQENFEVYIQALISQCLDGNFLDEVFSDQGIVLLDSRFNRKKRLLVFSDDYFVSNIEKVDSVTLLRKDKVMNGVSWSLRFQQALSTWPCLNDLGASAVLVMTTVLTFFLKCICHLFVSVYRKPSVVDVIGKKQLPWFKCLVSLTIKTH